MTNEQRLKAANANFRFSIGDWDIESHSDPRKVWIFFQGGEGGEFCSAKLAEVIGKFYSENF